MDWDLVRRMDSWMDGSAETVVWEDHGSSLLSGAALPCSSLNWGLCAVLCSSYTLHVSRSCSDTWLLSASPSSNVCVGSPYLSKAVGTGLLLFSREGLVRRPRIQARSVVMAGSRTPRATPRLIPILSVSGRPEEDFFGVGDSVDGEA